MSAFERSRVVLLTIVSALSILAVVGAPLQAAERLALLIGNAKYKHAPLRNPSNDVALMERALDQLGFKTFVHRDLTLEKMESAVREFRENINEGDLCVFYYAGHGVQVKGTNYLVPVKFGALAEHEVKYRTLSLGLVLDALDSSEANCKVVVLDCCRDNPFSRSWTRSLSEGLAGISDVPEGTILAYTTAPGETAPDGDGKTSAYTNALARALADRPQDGLEVIDVFRKASRSVYHITQQQPWISFSAALPEYYLWKSGDSDKDIPTEVFVPNWGEGGIDLMLDGATESSGDTWAAFDPLAVRVRVNNRNESQRGFLYLRVGNESQKVLPGDSGTVEAVAPFELEYVDEVNGRTGYHKIEVTQSGPTSIQFTRNTSGKSYWSAKLATADDERVSIALSQQAADKYEPRFSGFRRPAAVAMVTTTAATNSSTTDDNFLQTPSRPSYPATGWSFVGNVGGIKVYRDNSTGLQWTETLGKDMRFNEAQALAAQYGFRLPSVGEFHNALSNNMRGQRDLGYRDWFFWTNNPGAVMSIDSPGLNPASGLLNDGSNSVRGVR